MADNDEAIAADKDGSGTRTSPFAAPQITLPKGGGAIRGVGEKFAANPVTGTGSLTVPIAVSPGRSGFGPQFSLSYDSGTGNGPFGMGCTLSLPAITRKTDKGLPRYRDGVESDVFILSGAEDLVPVLAADGRGGWVAEELDRDGYRVKRYRPRVEGLFARIERWTHLCDGDVHWRSLSRDNVLTLYGSTTESRISDPANPAHTFSWLICESHDDRGNAIAYEYVAEDGAGVDLTLANERHRARTANRYLKRVRYGNRRPLLLDPDAPSFRPPHTALRDLDAADWMFEAVFDYGEGCYAEEELPNRGCALARASAVAPPGGHGPVRRDAFSSYRAGFEVRTYRLCRRVLMFHRFPEELGAPECLVRSTEFEYHEKPLGSFITRVTQSGYRLVSDGAYLKKSLPPLELAYTSSPLEDPTFQGYEVKDVGPAGVANLPGGIDGERYRWIDLDGEGIAGVLSEQGGAWFYKANLGNGGFGAAEVVAARPSLAALGSGRQQFLDLAGDGNLDLVELAPPTPGYYERSLDAAWAPFRPFPSLPVRDWDDPNLKFLDVTGDGLADVVITEDDALTWHPSLNQEGFGAAVRVHFPLSEEAGPRVLFADGSQSIYLADMSGDGLTDIVRVRNGEVCYWPNLGYGRFGPKVTMDNAPWFDDADLFDQRRVRLADTDGSGTTDVVYLGHDGVRLYLNETGQRWSDARALPHFPAADNLTAVSVVDFLGRGTACLLWSSPLPGDERRPLRYVDLMCGRKPHLLTHVRNNFGAETDITYASSTEFYLADKAAGTPWVTRLAFPVHVVARVETYDFISRNRFVSRYRYHHGYFDGPEREFRGFGMVEQLDTEEMAALGAAGAFPAGDNEDAASNVPPVLTKTWFHTGAFLAERGITRQFEHEYYREPGAPAVTGRHNGARGREVLLEDTALPEGLMPEEAREAYRSLKGSVLRQEVYALDGGEEAARPYTVAENNYTIRLLQSRGPNKHAVFFTHGRESLTLTYERKLYEVGGRRVADPRVAHGITLEVDPYGNVLKAVAVGYGRRYADPSPLLTDEDRAKQGQLLLTLTENRYTTAVEQPDAYRTPLLSEIRVYELIHFTPNSDRFRFRELAEKVARASDGAHDLPYEDVRGAGAAGGTPYRRLLKRKRTVYRSDRLERLLPLGRMGTLGLFGASYTQGFTPGLLKEVYRRARPNEPPEDLLPDPEPVLAGQGGYTDLDGNGDWWAPSGQVFYSPGGTDSPEQELAYSLRHFFRAHRFRDAFGNVISAEYDKHDLQVTGTRDPLGDTVSARHDYRVLSPELVTDPNGNRSWAAFDALGLVVGTAVMGKPGQQAGDTLDGFESDLSEATILEHLADPFRRPHAILQGATTRLVYDLFAYVRSSQRDRPQPAVVYTLARETHVTDLRPGQHTKVQHSFSYSDGLGRGAQKKAQAEPGPVSAGGPEVNPRWVGSGWTVLNNKGNPVRHYEPFFSASHGFEFANKVGVSPILCYDPLQRAVATVLPNHTYEKVVFDPWRQENWDVNDTVLEANPARDADVGGFIRPLTVGDYLPTWYDRRRPGDLGEGERQAALKAAVHANTPGLAYLDTLGRTFLTVAHNRFARAGAVVEEHLSTRNELDVEGKRRAVIDALGRVVMRYDYDMLGTLLRQVSVDAGARWMVQDVAGKPLLTWDSRGHRLRHDYDALRRPTDLHVRTGQGPEALAERVVYGEGQARDQARNLRGKVFRQFDGAGVVTNERYDFKGNLLSSTRQLREDYKHDADWSQAPELEDEVFATATSYDALNRPVAVTAPDASVFRPTYNEASLLDTLSVNLRGAAEATPFVTNVNYDAQGQRELIEYGNGAYTRYSYDPMTFRLARLITCRRQDRAHLQDLNYAYDPIGNITSIRDDAQETVYFRNEAASPSNEYMYDAIYRLIAADGREHAGRPGQPQPTWDDGPRMHKPLPSDGQAMHRYREEYEYDGVGNILKTLHAAGDGSWSRHYSYDAHDGRPANNRLTATRVGQDVEHYEHDAAGNMTRMPHLPRLEWDFKDQLRATQQRVVNAGRGETTYYVYNAAGQRVRKVTERASGSKLHERVYLGAAEIYREYDGVSAVTLQRETLHVLDDRQRVALVESRTVGDDGSPARLVRYQHGNHLGSACLELDDAATVISYEEYSAYGATTYEAQRSQTEAPKRYRYTGKERDTESGFYYHGARYYAPWLARWVSADPLGIRGGLNLFAYVKGNPVRKLDPTGTEDKDIDEAVQGLDQPQVHGKAGLQRKPITMDIDEPNAVGQRGISPAEARARATDVNNRQFLDAATNRRTKYLGTSSEPGAGGGPVSVANDPEALLTRRFGDITELRDVFNEAASKIKDPGKLSPTELKNRINSNMWDIIKTGRSDSAAKVRAALGKLGFENVPGEGYVMKAAQAGAGPVSGGGTAAAGAAADAAHPPPPPVEPQVKAPTPPEPEGVVPEPGGGGFFSPGGLASFGVGIIVNYVTTNYIAAPIVENNKFQKEQNALNQANHVPESAEDRKNKEIGRIILGGFPVQGLNIAAALASRFITDSLYDMVQGQREKDVQRFDEQNPDAPPEAFDQMQKLQETGFDALMDR